MNRDTDYPQALGVILGHSGKEVAVLDDVNWAHAVVEGLESGTFPDRADEIEAALETLLGLGTCNAATAIEKLRERDR